MTKEAQRDDHPKIAELKAGLAAVEAALTQTDKSVIAGYEESVNRLKRVISYVATLVEDTDPSFLTDTARMGIRDTLNTIAANTPSLLPSSAESWSESLLAYANQLPSALGRGYAARVARAAATLDTKIDEKLVAVAVRINDLSSAAEDGTEALAAFTSDMSEKVEQQLSGMAATFRARAEETLTAMEQYREDAAAVAQAKALSETAKHYGEQSDQEWRERLIWRLATLVLGAAAATWAALVAREADSLSTKVFVAKVLIAAIGGGIAFYTGTLAKKHDDRFREFRRLKLSASSRRSSHAYRLHLACWSAYG